MSFVFPISIAVIIGIVSIIGVSVGLRKEYLFLTIGSLWALCIVAIFIISFNFLQGR
mgnify:CR=1 FL=1